MKKTINLFLRVWLLSLFIPSSLFSQISNYYVKAGGTGNGTSWDSPLGSLPALAGVLNNVHIYIAEGDYTISGTMSTYYTYTGGDVLIQGGFPSTSTGTDLSAYNPEVYVSRIIKTNNGRCIVMNSTTNNFVNNKLTLKGIYFKSTNATVFPGNILNQEGGTQYYQLKVEECQIHDSESGSAFFRIASAVTGKVTHWFHNNKFYRNAMGATGPFEYTTVNGDVKVLLSGNLMGVGSATDGTGFYATTAGNSLTSQARFYIIGNIFSCGRASSTTGGIYLTTAGNTIIKNNVFLGVKGSGYGGAIFATAVGGLQIESNYFVQNGTTITGTGAGGAISIEGVIGRGSIVTDNFIKGNLFYENNLETTSFGGSAISLAYSGSATYDIIGNVFAYNTAKRGPSGSRQAVIQTRGNNIRNITNNVFYGNENIGGSQDAYVEIMVNDVNNISGDIKDNEFQLASIANYAGNPIQSKIQQGTGNTFGTTKASIAGLNAGDYTIDCYTGSVGCFKIDETGSSIIAKPSKVGISMFTSQGSNWPQRDFLNNEISNGVMVLASKSKPLVVTRVKNPEKTIGVDPQLQGAIAYDTEKKCLMLFDGNRWDCIAQGCDKTIYDILESIKTTLNIP